MDGGKTDAAEAAAYYNDADVAAFYRLCWGGDDIHIGRYDTGAESVADASVAMTRHLLSLAGIVAGDRVLDIACGYGGTLRLLARMGCPAAGIDISGRAVTEARRRNAEAGLDDRIDVRLGDFHEIGEPDGAWDAAICQESLIHSTDRPRVMAEVHRVLRPGGVFALSDILTAPGADEALVNEAFARLGARAGATPADYRAMAEAAGFEIAASEERPRDIRTHYDKLAEALSDPVPGLDPDARDAIAQSVARWRKALAGGHITWACLVASKPG
ncbi:cyclopropane-fatty-acyl-phospholipid synthase family protein [Rhodosalinus sp. FB01]|uniref:SAM-dependent methyltransferase n=1 Tax=Rhodosalinus sp. FB01 TaxID=3239194 RepID=UPI0035258898